MRELVINNKTIRIIKGDITQRRVDAIVNAANSYLQHGGGVAAAILKGGGKIIQEESDKIGFVPVGGAVMTSGGGLPCKVVIHAVGPRYGEGDEDSKLALAINNTLGIASQKGFASICMPAIGSGIFGFPKDRCAKILLGQAKLFLQKNTTIKIIEFCLFDEETLQHFERELCFLKNTFS